NTQAFISLKQEENAARKKKYGSSVYLLWDLNLDVGHSVRSVAACLQEAKDSTVRTALLDARIIAGNQEVFQAFSQTVTEHVLNHNTQAFISLKQEENAARKKKYGSSVYLLEPNLKEGEGGLRELQDALWIARVKFKASSLRELLIKGVINEKDFEDYLNAQDYLWRIRNILHFKGQRKSDQLTFELQQQIADFLGFKKNRKGSAVEQFMQEYYLHAIQVEYLATKLIVDATKQYSAPQNQLFKFLARRNLGDGFYIIRGELRAKVDQRLIEDPALMMVAFELSQRHNVVLCIELKQLIREHLHLINDKVRRSRRMTESFMTILRHPKNIGRTLRKMHHLKFLNAFLPEFKNIYCKVQFDLYHIYTVDIHSIFAVENMEQLWAGEHAETHPRLTQVAKNIEKPELLILAILFHDIGKGSGKDHSLRGAEMMPTVARRLRLNREDSQRLEFLVLHHLKMAHISQRRDLQDMKMIAQFAELMGMSETLNMLYLLTFADLKAVGPDIWTEWKGNLLRELYEKSYDVLEKKDFYLEQRSEKARNRKRKIRQTLLQEFSEKQVNTAINSLNTRYLMSYRSREIIPHLRLALGRGKKTLALQIEHMTEAEYTEVTLATLDNPGLFSFIAGVMAAHSINILGAQIHTRKTGAVLDVLQVNSPVGGIVNKPQKWKKFEADLSAVIEGRVRVEDLIRKRKQPSYLKTTPKRPQRPNSVAFDNEVSDRYTVIDVFAHDKVGLLYDITSTLNELGLYIVVSKISTKVDQAADVFYVNDIFGQKVTEPERLQEIRSTLLERLE
ncbi:MAG: [protein-PII] uridylyltransferase, partial [Deltaproteobacteria bacterium]|nr:[protein-PII] uridylyltransferase [Deltaproteobacteria bacterium]